MALNIMVAEVPGYVKFKIKSFKNCHCLGQFKILNNMMLGLSRVVHCSQAINP